MKIELLMQGFLRFALYAVVASSFSLLMLISHDWYRQLNQIDEQQEQIAELSRSYGEVMWRVTSARRWWLEYDQKVQIGYLTGISPSHLGFSQRYQFFKQNLIDTQALEGDVIEIAQETIDQLTSLLVRTEVLHRNVLKSTRITVELRTQSESIKKEVVSLAATLGTFQHVYFGPLKLQAPIKRDLMLRSFFFLCFLVVLAVSSIAIYRHGIIQEERAKQTKLEALGSLAAGYSHAISSIVGGLQIILDSLRVSSRNQRDLDAFEQFEIGIERMRSLNVNLTLIARGHPINDTVSSLQDTLELCVNSPENPYQPTIYHLYISHQASELLVPRLAISTIISELLNNSKHHIHPNLPPRVWIKSEVTAQSDLQIRVSDNGVGIPPQNISKVLDPFFSTSGEGHAGLGLTSIKSMVDAMGGKISITSRSGAHGTMVSINLPVQNGTVSPPRMGR